METKICKNCDKNFELSSKEIDFIKSMSVNVAGRVFELPLPQLCSNCRRQRRYAFRNDRNLYKRLCSKTGKTIISVHHADKEFPVYSQEAWWSDEHDPLKYGRDFDFNRSFFEQFADLQKVVPRISSMVVNSENSDYTAFSLQCRNCFLSSRLADVEDIYYSYLALKSNNCFDCYNVNGCELNYECIDCGQCYNCIFTERTRGSHDLKFCADMSGCSDCFGCVGLIQKQYYFFNEKYSKEEYERKVKEIYDGSSESIKKCRELFNEQKKKYPVRALNIFNSENIHGSYIFESKNIYNSFDMVKCEDAIDCTQTEFSKDVMDTDMAYYGERCYENMSNGRSMNILFSFVAMNGNSDIYYSQESYNSCQNLFGCIGMKKAQYCILNKQYTKEEYETLLPRVIEHMQKTGEWGEFFPHELSAFGYNETCAQNLVPLSKEEVLSKGWNWHDIVEEPIANASGENIIRCEISGKLFRLVPQEISFYKKMNLPLPTRHPDQRHKDRLKTRDPYVLLQSNCKKCGKEILTDKTEDKIIYCESCYLAEVY